MAASVVPEHREWWRQWATMLARQADEAEARGDLEWAASRRTESMEAGLLALTP